MARYCGTTPATATSASWDIELACAARNVGGVDNNRDFSVGSYFDGYEGADDATNHTQTARARPTPARPSSREPEDQNEDWLLEQHPNIRFSMNIHTSGGYFMWSPASYKTRRPRGAAVRVEGLAGGVLADRPQDGQADQAGPRHGRAAGPHRPGDRRAVLGRRATSRTRPGTTTTSSPTTSSAASTSTRRRRRANAASRPVGFQPTFATEGRCRGPGVRERHVRPDVRRARLRSTTRRAGGHAVGAERDDLADADRAGAERVGAVRHLLHDGRLDADDRPRRSTSSPGSASRRARPSRSRSNTTLKCFAVDPKGNTSAIQTATFVVDSVPPTTLGQRVERERIRTTRSR